MSSGKRGFSERLSKPEADGPPDNLSLAEMNAELGDPNFWRPLRIFFLYRLLLSSLFFVLYFFSLAPGFLGSSAPVLFSIVSPLYLLSVLSSSLFFRSELLDREQQAYAMLFIDIIALTLLMHASGGLTSGMGMLLVVTIAGGATMMGGRAALLFASLAALAVIAEQVVYQFAYVTAETYTQSGLLGATFMAVALLTHVLSKRVRASEGLANRRAVELASMAQLNDYIIQVMHTGVLALDQQGRIRVMNEVARVLLEMPDARVGAMLQSNAPELTQLLERWQKNPDVELPTLKSVPSSPEVKPIFHHLGEEGASTILIFLEDRTQINQQAQQMKLASLGRLTASIAHEIRNPLGAISHAGQLFAESPNLDEADRRLTEIIQTNSVRVNQVIENVMQLSRGAGAKFERIDLNDWLTQFLTDYIDNSTIEHVTVDASLFALQIEPKPCWVLCDPGQLRQIITNLCDNGLRYANLESKPAIQIVGGQPQDVDRPFVDIIDNGAGISADVVRQIFEPFFTTGSQGAGLGLYIAKELSEVNGARLEYLSVPTGGSCFRLHFSKMERR
ncbi:MAG: ATP-binding protein [Candidatus Polarisedimenticolaceae bacterium]|nr:ATP-binding protein [Candidatus Polarisedimenticolaceae bacterium]